MKLSHIRSLIRIHLDVPLCRMDMLPFEKGISRALTNVIIGDYGTSTGHILHMGFLIK